MAAGSRDTEARKKRKAPETEKKSKQKEKEREKPAKKMKRRNEIDDIFEELQRKKNRINKAAAEEGKTKPNKEIGEKKAKKKKEGGTEERGQIRVSPFSNSGDRERKKPRRKTGDGLPIYSAEELGVSNPDAGGTPLCPFDCSCCF